MGKALLLLVLSSGIILARQTHSDNETSNTTTLRQRDYQEETIAREISASAFNVAMAEIRSHGDDLFGAVNAFSPGASWRTGTYGEGKFEGGRYRVRAEMTSGISVRVVADGLFGSYTESGQEAFRSSFRLHDEYTIPALTARETSVIDVPILESEPNYCTALFYRAHTPDLPAGAVPEAVLLYTSDKNRAVGARPPRELVVPAGTVMNFFVAIDENCSLRAEVPVEGCALRQYVESYTFDASAYDFVHPALDVRTGAGGRLREEAWAFVEQHSTGRGRWRIAWEDHHNGSWAKGTEGTTLSALDALKRRGYDGTGWTATDARGYRQLQTRANAPDFNDVLVEVSLTPLSDAVAQDRLAANQAAREACGLTHPDPYSELPPSSSTPTDDGSTGDGSTDDGGSTPTTGGSTDPDADWDAHAGACKKKKVAVMHRPPGNESNEHVICISKNAVDTHLDRHNDYVVSWGNS